MNKKELFELLETTKALSNINELIKASKTLPNEKDAREALGGIKKALVNYMVKYYNDAENKEIEDEDEEIKDTSKNEKKGLPASKAKNVNTKIKELKKAVK